jgi:hypothetical protein
MAPVKREQFDVEREPFDAVFPLKCSFLGSLLQRTFSPSPFTTLMRPSFLLSPDSAHPGDLSQGSK